MRYVQKDPSLPHQVVVQMTGGLIYVSCNCLVSTHRPPMGKVEDFEHLKRLYNDPAYHAVLFQGPTFNADWMIGKEEELWSLLPRHSTENRPSDP